MDLELSDDQQELQASVRTVLEREAPVATARRVVEEGKGGEELWARIAELDWPALAVPEEDGGIGLGVVELAVVAEELGRVVAPVPFLATASQFVPVVAAAGTADQRAWFLGPVTRGSAAALAVAEGDGRYGFDAIATTAVPEGDGWRLDGVKRFVLDAERAEELVVSARLPGTSGETGVVVAVVPRDALRSEPVRGHDGTRTLATVVLDHVDIAGDRVLGEAGGGAPALRRGIDIATTVLSAELVGTCQGIFDILLAYAGEREQFGVKIGSFQAVKHKFSNMYVALESARATAFFAAAALDEEDDRAPLAVAMAKAAAGDCQKLIAQEGIQSLGGIGYTWEHDMHLYVKRAKTDGLLFGTASEHRSRVADLIGL